MGLLENVGNEFVLLRQRVAQEALVKGDSKRIPINWVHLDGKLAAFFPDERIDFSHYIEGVNARSLSNAYILGAVSRGDELAVKYGDQGEALDMIYNDFFGYRPQVLKFGDSRLHRLVPVTIKPGIHYGGEIVFWKKF